MKKMNRVTEFWKSQKPDIENMLLLWNASSIDKLERPEVMSYLPPLEGLSVLDLGAGIGRFTGEFAKKCEHVTALDFVPQFIEQNKIDHQAYSNITYITKDTREADFPKNSFDLVFISGVFMYLEDDELKALILKISDWLKDEGYLFFRDSCSPHSKTYEGAYSHQRPISYYYRLMDPLFTHVNSGSIQEFINRFADPFRCFWLYRKNLVKGFDK